MTKSAKDSGYKQATMGAGIRNVGLLVLAVGLIDQFFGLPLASLPDPFYIMTVGGGIWLVGFVLTVSGHRKQRQP